MSTFLQRPIHRLAGSVVFLALVFLIAACGDSGKSGGPNPTSTTFVAVVAGATESGWLSIDVATTSLLQGGLQAESADPVTASGSLHIGANPSVSLSGTYNNATHNLDVSGGGYTFSGGYTGGTLSGSYDGPNGPGGFSGQPSTSQTAAVAYCGTFTSETGGDNGTFNVVINGSDVSGVAVTTEGDVTPLVGSMSGNALTIPGLADGLRDGSTISGTFDDQNGNAGTWTGTACSS